MVNLHKNWVEFLFIVFLITGFIVAIMLPSATINYFVIFIFGIMSGRLWYKGKKNIKLPTAIVIIGLIIGYILGSVEGNSKTIITLFIVGNVFSYYVHNQKYIK